MDHELATVIQQNIARESETGNEKESWTVRGMSLAHLMPGQPRSQGLSSYRPPGAHEGAIR